ncbi:MAG: sel1 repeat family protein [Deltaproteobacteria bacterium]|nr:sel1 repeat family protein [Deltaproteobacteria bacterium]
MHPFRRSHIISIYSFNLYLMIHLLSGCVSKPPVVEVLDDEAPNIVVGMPGSVAYPEKDHADTEINIQDAADAPVGCTHDTQCKGERVCIAGTCVSPQYAEEYEARVMASARKTESQTPADNPIIEVLLPPATKRPLRCKQKQITRCMKQCDEGNLESCYDVGKIYETHPEDLNGARFGVYAYRKACDGGDAISCILLSRMYFVGAIVEQNLGLAFSLNVDGCVLKNMYACANAAVFLDNGIGVEQNSDMAAEYFTQACIYGHDPSCAKAKATDAP